MGRKRKNPFVKMARLAEERLNRPNVIRRTSEINEPIDSHDKYIAAMYKESDEQAEEEEEEETE